jgi:hypothetical protein
MQLHKKQGKKPLLLPWPDADADAAFGDLRVKFSVLASFLGEATATGGLKTEVQSPSLSVYLPDLQLAQAAATTTRTLNNVRKKHIFQFRGMLFREGERARPPELAAGSALQP